MLKIQIVNIHEILLKKRLFIAVLIVFTLGVAGCVSQQPEVLKVNPVIDYNPLEGFYNKSNGMFTVINGSIPEVKESLKDIIIKKTTQQSTFSADDELNFVVFRGVFSSGGYGIDIDRVERQGNAFTVYATYIDPGEGISVGAAFTQPVAIIPIGKLTSEGYEAKLKITKVKADADGTKIKRKVIEIEKEVSVFNFTVKSPEEGKLGGTPSIPNIPKIGGESSSSLAYRGTSTDLKLFISGNNITKGTEISLDYETLLLHTDGHFESNPSAVELIPEKKRLVFQQTVKAWDVPEKLLYSNLTINVSPYAADGSYYIIIAARYKDLQVGSSILSFKIGKGGKMYLQGRSEEEEKLLHRATWNIGYERYQSPPLNDTERKDARAITINDSYLKDRKYNITEITSESYDLQNFYGFLPVVTVDIGEPDKPGEIVRYTVDLEEKKIFKMVITPRKPLVEYFTGKAFDESSGNLTKRWNTENFAGFWHEPGTNISTEALVVDQNVLNSTYRVIEKHNLIYTTSPVLLKYNIYTYANVTPSGTEGYYPAIGWIGEKYVFLPGDRLAKIIFEQNATEVKTMVISETWKFGDGYKIYINSIDAKAAARQGWLSIFKDNNKIDDVVFPQIYTYTYKGDANYSIPVFVTYIYNMRSLPESDAVDFKYTWLRSQNITEIKEGDIFGIMEITSVKNGTVVLRNKEPINLNPGTTIRLMGNMSIQVGGSETELQFYPTTGR